MNILFSIKSIIKNWLPIVYLVFKHYQCNYALYRSGYLKTAKLIHKKANGSVYSGPFAGMRYISSAVGSWLIPKIIGCYEEELHSWVADLLLHDYSAIVNIGCAEGYYAIGFALKSVSRGRAIFAYDINPMARHSCLRMARLNNVADRIKIRGACTPETLEMDIRYPTLIISDCEGYESTILDPTLVPGLAFCDMLVETHDNTQEILYKRFSKTHTIDEVTSTPRNPDQYSLLNGSPEEIKNLCINEGRSTILTFWLLFRHRANA